MRAPGFLRLLVVMVVVAGASACTATIVPPKDVAQPIKVAVLDHGRHTTLVVGRPDGSMIRYAYGNWDWYARKKTGFVEGIRALFWPNPATLGRRELPGPVNAANLARRVEVTTEDALIFEVEAGAADRLVARLDTIFRAHPGPATYQPEYDLEFTAHPEPYSIAHNSNQVVAGWLEDLGCRVSGPASVSAWRVEAARSTP